MADSRPKLRWGFMGTASIATKNYLALTTSADNEIVAVASRSLDRAREWAEARSAAASIACYSSYGELLADARVEAVYIPLPTTLHLEWVLAAAAAGKHVLVEKPCAVRLADLRTMVAACAKAGVLFMDGVMYMHHARLPAMMAALPACGPLRRLDSGFSFAADASFFASNIRVQASLDPLGALGDLGWYQARFALLAFGGEMPTHAAATAHSATADGVPLESSATLFYAGDARVATFNNSFRTVFRQWVEVAGERGRIRCDDFVIARSPESADFVMVTKSGLVDDHCRVADETAVVQTKDCVQEACMFDAFAALARGGGDRAYWPKIALQTQAIMEACMASIAAGGARVAVELIEP